MMQTIAAKMNQPRVSPLVVLVAEKATTAGITRIPSKPPPKVEPTLAQVAVFSRSRESKVRDGIIDQKPVSLKA